MFLGRCCPLCLPNVELLFQFHNLVPLHLTSVSSAQTISASLQHAAALLPRDLISTQSRSVLTFSLIPTITPGLDLASPQSILASQRNGGGQRRGSWRNHGWDRLVEMPCRRQEVEVWGFKRGEMETQISCFCFAQHSIYRDEIIRIWKMENK